MILLVLLLVGSTTNVYCYSDIKSLQVNIIGGHPISISKVPYMAALLSYGKKLECGGNIISERYILSAAHCIKRDVPYKILVGSDDIIKGKQIYNIKSITFHPLFKNNKLDYDICLIELTEHIKFGPNVKPIELANDDSEYRPRNLFNVTGWGATKTNGTIMNKLQQVTVSLVKYNICEKFYTKHLLTDRMFCTGLQKRGPCNGDSGGPVTRNHVLMGISSFTEKFNCENAPAVNVKINVLRPWIKAKMRSISPK